MLLKNVMHYDHANVAKQLNKI